MLVISDGLRQELTEATRVSTILPGFTETTFADHVKDPKLQQQLPAAGAKLPMSPATVANAVVDQPDDLNIGEVTLR